MSPPTLGQPVPDFELPATGGKSVRLSALRGQAVVLYFYPKDSTPGCALESRDFRDQLSAFARAHALVLGVSRDGLRSHERFKGAECLPFELLSDEDEALCRQYDVLKEKNMYGKKVMGIERSTFLIDGDGVLRREWRKVKVEGHVAEVLLALQTL
jgi:thioredoxin-dependent peroxiredoxin